MSKLNTRSVVALIFPCAVSSLVFLTPANSFSARMHTKSTILSQQSNRSGLQFETYLATGLLNGEAHEFVYWPDEGNHKASELIWKLENVFMLGAGASLKPTQWLKLNIEGWSIASDGEGSMDDYDWLEPGQDWTDWSHHNDVTVTKGSRLDFNAQIPVFNNQTLTINTFLGYKSENWEWEARGGSFIYSTNGFRDTTGIFPEGELGITYEQTVNVPYAGLGLTLDANPFRLQTRILGSTLVSGEAVDQHHMRSLVVYDDFSGGNMFAFEALADFMINQNFSVGGGFYYTNYDSMTGDSEWHFSDGQISVSPDGAGMDLQHTMLLINLLYRF